MTRWSSSMLSIEWKLPLVISGLLLLVITSRLPALPRLAQMGSCAGSAGVPWPTARGYFVLDAEHGERGLEIARNYPGAIHLLLTDVMMPGMTGPDLVAPLEKVRPGIPVLYMSGYPESAAGRKGFLEAGASLLRKPFGPAELARRVSQSLDGAA